MGSRCSRSATSDHSWLSTAHAWKLQPGPFSVEGPSCDTEQLAYLAEPSGALHNGRSSVKHTRQTKDTQPPTPTSTSTSSSTPAPTLHPPFPWSAIAPAPAPSLTTDPSAEPNCSLSHGLTRVVHSFDHKETSALLLASLLFLPPWPSQPASPTLAPWRSPPPEFKTNSSRTGQEPEPEP